MVFSVNKKASGQQNNRVIQPTILNTNLPIPNVFLKSNMFEKVKNSTECITCKNIR